MTTTLVSPGLDLVGVGTTTQLVALLPAHNEEATIAEAVSGLQSQTRAPDRIIVVADNCSDGTVALALAAGAEVFETLGNTDKKAGALNQALAAVLPELNDQDYVLVQDADSLLDVGFVAAALRHLLADDSLVTVYYFDV